MKLRGGRFFARTAGATSYATLLKRSGNETEQGAA